MIRFVYGIVPAFIEVADDIHPANADAKTDGLTIKIRPQFANSEPRIQHELEHVRQNIRQKFMPWVSRSRLQNEVDAYRAQLRYYPAGEREARIVELAANLRDPVYGFPITQEEAEARLRA